MRIANQILFYLTYMHTNMLLDSIYKRHHGCLSPNMEQANRVGVLYVHKFIGLHI